MLFIPVGLSALDHWYVRDRAIQPLATILIYFSQVWNAPGLARLVGAYIAKQGTPFLLLIIPVGKHRWRDFGRPQPLRTSASAIVGKMLLGACTLPAIVQVA